MVGKRRIRFVIVLDSCCISIGLVFIKDRPVSSFWVLRFRVLGASFSRFRGLRFRVLGASFSIKGASFSSFGCFVLRSSFSKLPHRMHRMNRRSVFGEIQYTNPPEHFYPLKELLQLILVRALT